MKIIVLSMYNNEAYVVEALQAGASAYVLKKATSSDLLHAMRRVLEGGLYLSPPLDERLSNRMCGMPRNPAWIPTRA